MKQIFVILVVMVSTVSTFSDIILVDFTYGTADAPWNTMRPGTPWVPDLYYTSGLDSGLDMLVSSEFYGSTGPAGEYVNTAPWAMPAADDGITTFGQAPFVWIYNVSPGQSLKIELLASSWEQSFYSHYRINGEYADNNPTHMPFNPRTDGYLNGTVMIWSNVVPDENGLIELIVQKNTAKDYGMISAMRIEVVPETSTMLLVLCGVLSIQACGCCRRTKNAEQRGSPYSSPAAGSESGDL